MNDVHLSIGIDLGQRTDPTAIAVVELIDATPTDATVTHWRYEVRHIERLPLGTKYPDVAARLREIQQNVVHLVKTRTTGPPPYAIPDVSMQTWMDATGAIPAYDLFIERGIEVTPCFFTHGDRRTEADGRVTIGKAWLVNRLQALAQDGRLRLPPNHPEAAAMVREFQDYEIRIDQNANDRYGAFKTGTHDDLVSALGLAVQWSPDPLAWHELERYMANQGIGIR